MTAADDAFLDAEQVYMTLGIGRSTFFKKIAEGRFPKAVDVLGCRRWSRNEVQAWLRARVAERDAGAGHKKEAARERP